MVEFKGGRVHFQGIFCYPSSSDSAHFVSTLLWAFENFLSKVKSPLETEGRAMVLLTANSCFLLSWPHHLNREVQTQ